MTENNQEKKYYKITHDYTDEEILTALSQLPEYNRRVILNTYLFGIIATAMRCDDGFTNMIKCLTNNIEEAKENIRGFELVIETMTDLKNILAENDEQFAK